jgi:adenylate cyclase
VVISGGLGTSDRLHYTIIGDTVNTTQRIEALTRDLMDTSGVLASRSTFNALIGAQDRFKFIPLGEFNVKGKAEPIEVSRLLPPDALEGK